MTDAIEVRALTRRFGDLVAVDHVSFQVERGEVFGFLGPNGAGKTTTVRMLTGVLDPSEGTARIQGHDIRTDPLRSRAHMAVVPEEANVYVDLSVWQNVMLMAELHGIPRPRRVREGERLLNELGLAHRKRQKARVLSKGMRQRLMLCTALVTDPETLFLDEPTSGLDVQSARLIRGIVRDRNRDGLTVFLTTHNMDEAEEMCSRVAIINRGRIAAIDTPDGLRDTVRSRQYTEVRFEDAGPSLESLGALPGVAEATAEDARYRLYTETPGRVAAGVVRLADSRGWKVTHLCTKKPSLEDVFIHLIAKLEGADR